MSISCHDLSEAKLRRLVEALQVSHPRAATSALALIKASAPSSLTESPSLLKKTISESANDTKENQTPVVTPVELDSSPVATKQPQTVTNTTTRKDSPSNDGPAESNAPPAVHDQSQNITTSIDSSAPKKTMKKRPPSKRRPSTFGMGGNTALTVFLRLALLLLLACIHCTQNNYNTVMASGAVGSETLLAVVGRDFVMLAADTASVQSIVKTVINDRDKIHTISDGSVVVAAGGDVADVDQLVATLRSHATLQEYEASTIGGDVNLVDLRKSSGSSNPPRAPVSSSGGLSAGALAHLARTEISQRLRSAVPYRVGLLVAGMEIPAVREGTATTRRRGSYNNYGLSSLSMSNIDMTAFVSGDVQKQLQRATTSFADGEDTHPATKEKKKDVTANDTTTPATTTPCLYWLDEYGALQNIRYASHGMAANFANAILDRHYNPDLTRDEAAQLLQECFQQLSTRYIINNCQQPLIKCLDETGCHVYTRITTDNPTAGKW